MINNTPTLCLDCGNFPCTCGKQYRETSTKNLIALSLKLLDILANERLHAKINTEVVFGDTATSLYDLLQSKDGPGSAIFNAKDIWTMPKTWRKLLTQNAGKETLADFFTELLNDNVDAVEHPSGLAAVCVYAAWRENGIITLLNDYVRSLSPSCPAKRILGNVLDGGSFGEALTKSRSYSRKFTQAIEEFKKIDNQESLNEVIGYAKTYRIVYKLLLAVKNQSLISISYGINALQQAIFSQPGWTDAIREADNEVWYDPDSDLLLHDEHVHFLHTVKVWLQGQIFPPYPLFEV